MNFKIILTTNLTSEFINEIIHKLADNNIRVWKVFSCVSDYMLPKKNELFYAKVISMVNVEPYEILHVGDNEIYDYLIPTSLGMNALLIKRNGSKCHVSKSYRIISFLNELLLV